MTTEMGPADAAAEMFRRGWVAGRADALTEVERLADGINAAVIVRLISGDTDQKYSPSEVSALVASAIGEQRARLPHE